MNPGVKMMLLFSREGEKEEHRERKEHTAKPEKEEKERFDPEEWVDGMENADGTSGEHWTYEQTEAVRKQVGSKCDPEAFWTAMNMMHSDYSKVLKAYNADRPEVYGSLAEAFLCDKDSKQGMEKLKEYWKHIVK